MTKTIAIFSLALALALAGCTVPGFDKPADVAASSRGSLTLGIAAPGSSSGRTIVPASSDLAIASYTVTLTRTGSTTVTKSVTSSPCTIDALDVGDWAIQVDGKTAAAATVASGTGTVSIVASTPASATVNLSYAAAATGSPGSASVTLVFPKTLGIDAVSGSLDGTDISSSLAVADNGDSTNSKVVFSSTSIVSGNPLLSISLKKGSVKLLAWTERVWVYKGVTTTASVTLASTLFAAAPAAPATLTAALSGSNISLVWLAVSIAESYTLERSTNSGSTWTTVASGSGLAAGTLSYADAFTSGTSYLYRVSAVNNFGSSTTTATTSAVTPVLFTTAVQSGGTSNSVATTSLTLTFGADPTTLAASDITVTGATKGALTGTGTTRSLAISAITVANGATVSVAVASPAGFTLSGSPQTAVVYVAPTAVTFSGATQVGGVSNNTSTASLTLTFSADPTSLAASDITLTGATKGALTGTGTTRSLAISAITVANGATVSVAVASPLGFTISASPQTAVVYKPVTFSSAVQSGGTSDSVTTTDLTLTFSVDPTTLAASDITVTGATKGALSGGPGLTRSLALSAVSVANGATVSVAVASPSGFTITGSPQTAVVYKAPTAVTFSGLTKDAVNGFAGTPNFDDTLGLALTFDVDPTSLTAADITVTGATKGTLTTTGATRYLRISNLTVINGATVQVDVASPSGFTISESPRTAIIARSRIPVTFSGAAQVGGTSNAVSSTSLLLTFSADPTTLAASDITLTGATKGALTGTGTTRSLEISAITVANAATVSVAIANPNGYTISGSPQTAVVYKWKDIGDAYQGGKIAYLLQPSDTGYDANSPHGLIASTVDLSTGIAWIVGTSWPDEYDNWRQSVLIGTGQANTNYMISTPGYTGGAAKVCNDYTNADTGTGVYSDWYLPSKDELNKLYLNRTALGGFQSVNYWSSSQQSGTMAWTQNLSTSTQSSPLKSSTTPYVRAMRSF